MLITFCFGVSSNLSQEKSPTAEILGKYFLRTIVPRKYMHKISAVGLFSCDKFEEITKQKVIDIKYTLISGCYFIQHKSALSGDKNAPLEETHFMVSLVPSTSYFHPVTLLPL